MILHWDPLVLHYGSGIGAHRSRFEEASQTTYGLLCCRYSPTEDELGYSAGAHAEANLLQSALWTTHLPNALRQWTPRDSRITVTMALNRSPCRACAALLIDALSALYREFPARSPQNRFILAARGAYEDANMVTRTTQNDLVRLRDAGWELCVLQVGRTLSARGRILLEGIERVAGRGIVRLHG
jgi:hypothetical protein